MRNRICQEISNVTMRRDISLIDRQLMNNVTAFLAFEFADPILYRFNKTRQFYSHKTAPSAVWRKYKQN